MKSYTEISESDAAIKSHSRYQRVRVEIIVIVEPGKDQRLLYTPCLGKSVVISDGPSIATDLVRFDA